jgi:hypothetical protein
VSQEASARGGEAGQTFSDDGQRGLSWASESGGLLRAVAGTGRPVGRSTWAMSTASRAGAGTAAFGTGAAQADSLGSPRGGEQRLALPHALRANSDDVFVRTSVEKRLPDILQSVLDKDEGRALGGHARELVKTFIAELRTGSHKVAVIDGADGGPDWSTYDGGRAGLSSSACDWFYLENYAYRKLMRQIVYFDSRLDPFRVHKREALAAGLAELAALGARADACAALAGGARPRDVFHELLLNSLWGNAADLSFSSGRVEQAYAHGRLVATDDSLRCWDHAIAPHVLTSKPCSLVLVLDNCGAELLHDLLLADFLLAAAPRCTLRVHCKSHPVFVSDAIEADVLAHVEALAGPLPAVAGRLRAALASRRVLIEHHDFYTSPLPWWHAPHALRAEYLAAALTVTKGDANFRRLVGDRHWPVCTPFGDVVAYWGAPLLALRTCKAPLCVGIPRDFLAAPRAPDWLVSGKTGLVLFHDGAAAAAAAPASPRGAPASPRRAAELQRGEPSPRGTPASLPGSPRGAPEVSHGTHGSPRGAPTSPRTQSTKQVAYLER